MTIRISPTLSCRTIGDEVFALDRKHSKIHTFNRTGTFIWNLLPQNLSSDAMAQSISDRFEVSLEQAHEDVFDFLMTLSDNALIEIKDKEQ